MWKICWGITSYDIKNHPDMSWLQVIKKTSKKLTVFHDEANTLNDTGLSQRPFFTVRQHARLSPKCIKTCFSCSNPVMGLGQTKPQPGWSCCGAWSAVPQSIKKRRAAYYSRPARNSIVLWQGTCPGVDDSPSPSRWWTSITISFHSRQNIILFRSHWHWNR